MSSLSDAGRPARAGALPCGGRGSPFVEGAPERLEGDLRELRVRGVQQRGSGDRTVSRPRRRR